MSGLVAGGSAPVLRLLAPGDSLVELTELIHRAFARLGRMGLNCTSVAQDPGVTRERVARGTCFVAVAAGRIVGTVTVYGAERDAEIPHYRNARVASVHQLAVDPAFQGANLGGRLLALARDWAKATGRDALALDTPQPARHLVAYYRRRRFHPVALATQTGRNYRSVVFLERWSRIRFPAAGAARQSVPSMVVHGEEPRVSACRNGAWRARPCRATFAAGPPGREAVREGGPG